MPYLAFDLDAKKRVPQVARAAGVQPCEVGWGLLDLWEHVWSTRNDVVGELLLDGFFGPNARIREALVAFGFLEPQGVGSYRVKGADRYSRISTVRSEGGKTRISSAKRDAKGRLVASSTHPAEHPAEPAQAGRELDVPPAQAGSATSSRPAADQLLHRAPSTESSTTSSNEDVPREKPKRKKPDSAAVQFVDWTLSQRKQVLGPSAPDPDTPAEHHWIALSTLLRDHGRMPTEAAWLEFAKDGWAKNNHLPLAVFLAQKGRWLAAGTAKPTQPKQVSRRLA